MWSGDDTYNEDGEPVRLYLPVLHRRPCSTSFVGGSSTTSNTPNCTSCHDPLYLLVQLQTSNPHRTIQVYACNRWNCLSQKLFDSTGSKDWLCYGGNGVVVCQRENSSGTIPVPGKVDAKMSVEVNEKFSDWLDNRNLTTADTSASVPSGSVGFHVNEWTVDTDTGSNGSEMAMNELESKLAAMETSRSIKIKQSSEDADQVQLKVTSKEKKTIESPASFPCFDLFSLVEPPALVRGTVDQDDVGIGRSNDDIKIKLMLQRYLEQEEDQDIVAFIRDGSNVICEGGGVEYDEKLPSSERALLSFSDRLKRSPQQVLRYARGGQPLWSM